MERPGKKPDPKEKPNFSDRIRRGKEKKVGKVVMMVAQRGKPNGPKG